MTSPRRPGRPRSPEAHRAVLEAVIELLGDQGLAAMSVEAVAERARVSKATIYRHWSSKQALCAEAVACVVFDAPDARGGAPRRALESLLLGLAGALERSDAGRLLPHLASAAATDRRLADIWRDSLVEPVSRRVAGLVREAIEAGELALETDVEAATELLLAPLFYRRLVSGAPFADRRFVAGLVDVVWAHWSPP
jgi:AcrR family transcriptional regulator